MPKDIPILATNTVPGYEIVEVVGDPVVASTPPQQDLDTAFTLAMSMLKEYVQQADMGDAIVGFGISGQYVYIHRKGQFNIATAYGTVVRLKKA